MKIRRSFCLAATLLTFCCSTNTYASLYNFSFTGVFSLQQSSGNLLINTDATTNTYSGYRTDISGSYQYDSASGVGTFTIIPFDFFGGGPLAVQGGLTTNIGDGFGNPGNLMLGNFSFNWNGNNGIQADLVWDATGLFDALANPNFGPGSVISGNQLFNPTGPSPVTIGSILPASDGVVVSSGPSGNVTVAIGPTPMATTAYNVTTGTGPSGGGLPLINDPTGVAGSPNMAGPYQGSSISLDIGNLGSMHLISVTPSPVPIPAAIWLFGSGLLGLFAVTKRYRK